VITVEAADQLGVSVHEGLRTIVEVELYMEIKCPTQ
jgi:hypothetical protein